MLLEGSQSLSRRELPNVTVDELIAVTVRNDKSRFRLWASCDGELQAMSAKQGHSGKTKS